MSKRQLARLPCLARQPGAARPSYQAVDWFAELVKSTRLGLVDPETLARLL